MRSRWAFMPSRNSCAMLGCMESRSGLSTSTSCDGIALLRPSPIVLRITKPSGSAFGSRADSRTGMALGSSALGPIGRSPRSKTPGVEQACQSRHWRGWPTLTPSARSASRPAGALWQVRALAGEPLPLFAAADRDYTAPEVNEPDVELVPMPAGREVVEDYRSKGVTLAPTRSRSCGATLTSAASCRQSI